MLLMQDPVQCLQDSGGWDVVSMVDGLDNFSAVSAEQGRIPGTVVNETFRLDWDKEGKVTSFKFGKIVRSPRRAPCMQYYNCSQLMLSNLHRLGTVCRCRSKLS